MSRVPRIRVRFGMLLLSGVVGAVACGGAEDAGVASIPVIDLDGRETTVAEEADGRMALVSLWAVWCQPCKKEIPVLDEIAVEHPDVAVIALNIGDEEAAIRDFVDEFSVKATVVIDRDGDVLSALGAPTVPVTVILGSDGEVRWKHIGAVDADIVRAAVTDAR